MADASAGSKPTKLCIRCGLDCSGRARTKDAQGRYICGDCLASAKAAQARVAPALPPPATHDEAIPLAGDEPIGLIEHTGPPPRTCAGCGALLARTAVLCTSCGTDTRTGQRVAAPSGSGPKCINCGYSLQGLKKAKCPECGTSNAPADRKKIVEKRAAQGVVRDAYLKPVIMFSVGITISIVAAMIGEGSFDEGLGAALGYLIKYAVYVPVGVIVFLGCCLLWMGFDAPIHLIALRLAAVYAVTDAVGVFVGFIPIGIVQWAIMCMVYVGLLQDMLELDLNDALLVGIITFAVRAAILLFVLAWLSGLFSQ